MSRLCDTASGTAQGQCVARSRHQGRSAAAGHIGETWDNAKCRADDPDGSRKTQSPGGKACPDDVGKAHHNAAGDNDAGQARAQCGQAGTSVSAEARSSEAGGQASDATASAAQTGSSSAAAQTRNSSRAACAAATGSEASAARGCEEVSAKPAEVLGGNEALRF